MNLWNAKKLSLKKISLQVKVSRAFIPIIVYRTRYQGIYQILHRRKNTRQLDKNFFFPIFFQNIIKLIAIFQNHCRLIFYRIESISLTEKQCDIINKAWLTPWLHRIGFSSKTNINVRYMLQEDGGLELFKSKI